MLLLVKRLIQIIVKFKTEQILCIFLSCTEHPFDEHFVNQHPTSHIPHPTSRRSYIPNIPHPEHTTSRTYHIPNIPHPEHPTSPTSHIPNIPHPEHPTSLTSHIPNIQHPQNSTYGQQSKSNTSPFIVWFVDIFGKDFWK